MRSLVLINFALIVMVGAICQQSIPPKAIPSRRLVTRGDMYGPLSEVYLDLAESAGKPGDMVAMRICSNDPLPVAIIEAVVDPIAVGTVLTSGTPGGLAYSNDHILIQRSPECPVTHPPYVPVEFWGIPRGAALPLASEVAKLCQVRISGTSWGDVTGRQRNARSYRAALAHLLTKLRNESEAVAVIYGEYNLHPGNSLKRSLEQAESFFRRSGLPRDRFFVRMKPSAFEGAKAMPEPRFPNLVIVRIAKKCEDE